MILILTETPDEHADAVIDALHKRGAKYVRFDTAEFPTNMDITLRFNDLKRDQTLVTNGGCIDLKMIQSVWYRRPNPPEVSQQMSFEDQEFARREAIHLLRSLWQILRDRFWVNPWEVGITADHKPYQLQTAVAVGLTVPRTLITNDPSEARDFFERCGGHMVYKAFGSYCTPSAAKTLMKRSKVKAIFTNVVNRDDLVERMNQIKLAPCIFQEYVAKQFELRVTVIGHQVFAAEIQSQASEVSKHDWRRYDLANTPYRQFKLPDLVTKQLHELMRRLGLVFGCADFIVTPDGQFVFLELNPNGQWLWIQSLTGMCIQDSLAEMLAQATQNFRPPTSSSHEHTSLSSV